MKLPDEQSALFRVLLRPNAKAKKVLFFLTSYGFPWWVYRLQISLFRHKGYEVVVYDLHDKIIENDDPSILSKTVSLVVEDMASRRKYYEAGGVTTFHGIGNSLGSYFLFNYAIRYSIEAIVLNGGGSIADIIFHHTKGTWKQTADIYASKGFNSKKLRILWASHDDQALAKNIKAKRILMMWSVKDGTIPHESAEAFAPYFKQSGKVYLTETDSLPHIPSVIKNSLRIRRLYNFLNGH